MLGLGVTGTAAQKATVDSALGAVLVSSPLWMQSLESTGTIILVLLGCAIAVFRLIIMRYEYKRTKEKAEHHD